MNIKHKISLNFIDLLLILGPALGLSVFLSGSQLSNAIGPGQAISSILLGNGILWFIGIAIINMAKNNEQTIENIKNYLGDHASKLAGVIWIITFLIWFVIQLRSSSAIIATNIDSSQIIPIGAFLGFITSITSFGSISLIKSYAKIISPLTLILLLLISTSSGSLISDLDFKLSYDGVFVVIFNWLPLTISLPTFFRYTKSESDSIIGLTLITFVHIALQILPIIFGINSFANFYCNTPALICILISLSMYFLINYINIYCSLSGVEAFLPSGYATFKPIALGITGTLAYVLIEFSKTDLNIYLSVHIIEKILTSFIANLGVVLIISYIVKSIIHHRPRNFEKFWNFVCWIAGCGLSLIEQSKTSFTDDTPLINGMALSFFGLILVLFVEETIWSSRHLKESRDLNQHLD